MRSTFEKNKIKFASERSDRLFLRAHLLASHQNREASGKHARKLTPIGYPVAVSSADNCKNHERPVSTRSRASEFKSPARVRRCERRMVAGPSGRTKPRARRGERERRTEREKEGNVGIVFKPAESRYLNRGLPCALVLITIFLPLRFLRHLLFLYFFFPLFRCEN